MRAPRRELYDLEADPEESRNLAAARPDLTASLERDLQEARRRLAMGGGSAESDPVRDVGGIKLMARAVTSS